MFRRRLLCAAAIGLAAPYGGAANALPALARNGRQLFPMIAASRLREGWGVCLHLDREATADQYSRMLSFLGTAHVRGPLAEYGRSMLPQYEALDAAMRAVRAQILPSAGEPVLRCNVLIEAYRNDPTTWQQQQPILLAFARSRLLASIEGPNEINSHIAGGGSHGPADTQDRTASAADNMRRWAEAIHAFRGANPSLAQVQLVAPSIVVSPHAYFRTLPDLAPFVDATNMHFYAGGGLQPDLSLPPFNLDIGSFSNILHWLQAQSPGVAVWMTECGASTSGNYARSGVTQAQYLANQILDFFADGGQRLFIYELTDGSSREGDTEGNFGLFHHDLTPKPAATMLRGLQMLLAKLDDGPSRGPDFQGLALPGFGSPDPNLPRCLIVRGTTADVIAVWNEPKIDDGKGDAVQVATRKFSLGLGRVRRCRVHDMLAPDFGDLRGQWRNASEIELSLAGHPLLVELGD